MSVVCSAVRLKWFSFEWEGRGKRGGGMLIENLWLGDEFWSFIYSVIKLAVNSMKAKTAEMQKGMIEGSWGW